MATSTNIFATAHWIPETILILWVRFRHSAEISSERLSAVQSGRTAHFSSQTTRDCVRTRASALRFLFLPLRPARAYSVRSHNQVPAVARRTEFPVLSTPIRRLELTRRFYPT